MSLIMVIDGRRLSVKETDRSGVSLDLFVNREYVGSTRRGSSAEAQMAAMEKLLTMVRRADHTRKPEKYDSFWYERPFADASA